LIRIELRSFSFMGNSRFLFIFLFDDFLPARKTTITRTSARSSGIHGNSKKNHLVLTGTCAENPGVRGRCCLSGGHARKHFSDESKRSIDDYLPATGTSTILNTRDQAIPLYPISRPRACFNHLMPLHGTIQVSSMSLWPVPRLWALLAWLRSALLWRFRATLIRTFLGFRNFFMMFYSTSCTWRSHHNSGPLEASTIQGC